MKKSNNANARHTQKSENRQNYLQPNTTNYLLTYVEPRYL